jgi:hypothetical protein
VGEKPPLLLHGPPLHLLFGFSLLF